MKVSNRDLDTDYLVSHKVTLLPTVSFSDSGGMWIMTCKYILKRDMKLRCHEDYPKKKLKSLYFNGEPFSGDLTGPLLEICRLLLMPSSIK